MNRKTCLGAAFALVSVIALGNGWQALAATQGAVGSTSTGSVVITATVPNLVRISGLNDIALGTWSGTGDMTGSDSLCVWSTTRKYAVTATGSGASSAFTLTSGGTTPSTIAYTVQWADSSGASTGTAMTAGTPVTTRNTTATSTTCAGGTNATVLVRVAETDLAAAPAAAYTGTLTLVVAPE